MKRPLLVIAVGYIIGIVWGLYCNCSIAFLYIIILLIKITINIKPRKKRKLKIFSLKRFFRYIKIYVNSNVIFIIIITSLISNIMLIRQNNKYNNLYNELKNVSIIGYVISNIENKEYTNTCEIKVESINGNKKYKNTYLILNIKKDKLLKICYGDKIKIEGEFSYPEGRRNFKGFDYREYLKSQNVYGIVKANEINIINNKKTFNIFVLSNNAFLTIKENVENLMPKEFSSLVLGIILGFKENIDERVMEQFKNSSMAHILTVSGMHISYIILITYKLLIPIIRKEKDKCYYYTFFNYIYIYLWIYTIYNKSYNNGIVTHPFKNYI